VVPLTIWNLSWSAPAVMLNVTACAGRSASVAAKVTAVVVFSGTLGVERARKHRVVLVHRTIVNVNVVTAVSLPGDLRTLRVKTPLAVSGVVVG